MLETTSLNSISLLAVAAGYHGAVYHLIGMASSAHPGIL